MTKKPTHKPVRSDDVPCTKAHLELVRQELKSDITSLSLKMDSKFQHMDSKFEKMSSVLFEMKALFEEQNSRNRVVLDGYAHLFDKSLSVESRIENLEKKVFGTSQK